MWGTLDLINSTVVQYRFIPTHVGNTGVFNRPESSSTVHPHACGEHVIDINATIGNIGSSPRMWGTHCHNRLNTQKRRFIPTHVGNTNIHDVHGNIVTVHPHACGEHHCFNLQFSVVVGSSPRMWGTPSSSTSRFNEARFIPTHVGNTLLLSH